MDIQSVIPATVSDAIALADAGLFVFPCAMDKSPVTANGFKDARQRDVRASDAYPYKTRKPAGDADNGFDVRWGPWPAKPCLIGVATGASGLVVIDVDDYKAHQNDDAGDVEDLAADAWLAKRAPLLNTARIHRTMNGGTHYVFRAPRHETPPGMDPEGTERVRIKSRAGIKVGGQVLSYVDVRAEGGYVIWWAAHGCDWTPSEHIANTAPGLMCIPELPPELLADLLESCRETSAAPPTEAAKRDPIVAAFQSRGWYRREKAAGVHCVTCPWIAEHPGGKQHADDTAVYFEANFNGRSHNAYVCKDAACDGKRTLAQLRAIFAAAPSVAQTVSGDVGPDAARDIRPADVGPDREAQNVSVDRPSANRGALVSASDTDAWIGQIEATAQALASGKPTPGGIHALDALLTAWPEHLMRSRDGAVLSTPKNTLVAMGYTPQTFGAFVYDEFLGSVMVTRDLPHLPHVTAPFEWQDDLHWMAIASWLNRHGLKPGKDIVCDAVRALADGRRMNSARSYFEGLQWDGTPRLNTWLARYCGAQGSADYLSRVGAWFLMGVAARACNPGAKQDYTLVFVMKQGVGKTTVAQALAVRPEWFTDRVSALGSKDSLMELRGRLVVEMAELEVFRKSEVETQKAFLTSTVDKYRAPYGRSILSYPRTCCFIGTTNEEAFLHDLTGNRRFWPVKCGDTIDVEGLRRALDQLYAEAYHRWKGGERHWPSVADNPIMEREQERYRIVSPLEETLVSAIMTSPPQDNVTNEWIFSQLMVHGQKERAGMARQVTALMRKLGYVQDNVRVKGVKARVWRRKAP